MGEQYYPSPYGFCSHHIAVLGKVEDLKWEAVAYDRIAIELVMIFPGVTDLEIIDMKFSSFTHFTNLICMFPVVEKISIASEEEYEMPYAETDLLPFTQKCLPIGLC